MRKKLLTSLILIGTLVFTTAFAFAGTSVSRYTGSTYSHNSRFDSSIIVNGLDVSIYQKTIDWQQAKADGVDFAIIRVGGRGYGSAGKLYSDDNFAQNIKGARAAGIMVGVYFFSQAINEMEAVAEVRYAVELMNKAGIYELDLPLFMDYEFSGGSSGRLTQAKLSKTKATKIARAFCEEVKLQGYKPGIYANLNFLNKTIDGASLGKEYPIWAAQYYSRCDFEGDYTWWQYASSGKVSGISGSNDCNFWYLERNPQATSVLSIASADVILTGPSSYTYSTGTAFEPSVSVYSGGIRLTEGVDYKVRYVNNSQAGTAYAMVIGKGSYTDYRLVPFEIKPSSNLSGITVADIPDMTYTGSVCRPSGITVKDSSGRILKNNLDYTYTVSNAVNAGKAGLKITFDGSYKGTKTVSYNINKAKQTLTIGNAKTGVGINEPDFNLNVSLKFDGAKLTYSSSNKEVATVSSSGTVSVKSPGTTTITVKAAATENVESASKSFTLTVTKPQQTVTSRFTKFNKTVGSPDFRITGVTTDGDGKISFESSDKSVASVTSGGKVSVKGVGTAIITIKASETENYGEGIRRVTVKVTKAAQTVTTSYTKYKRKELDKMFNINAKTDGDGEITYTSSDETVASVDTKGRVTVVGPGTAEITATASETAKFGTGQKIVTLTVSPLDAAERETVKADLIAGVQNTTVVSVKTAALSNKVTIEWKKKNTGYDVDYYQVYRSTKKSSGYKRIYTTRDSKEKSCTNFRDVKPNTTYWYKVRGVRVIDGETVYTPFTKVSVKTKK